MKQASVSEQSRSQVAHLKIPFQVCLSTEVDKPSDQVSNCLVYNLADSNTVNHKTPRSIGDKRFVFLRATAQKDCVFRVTVSASSWTPSLGKRRFVHSQSSIKTSKEMHFQDTSLMLRMQPSDLDRRVAQGQT